MALNLFPIRVAIGETRGNSVYMTREFSNALSDLLERVGGPNGVSTTELMKLVKALGLRADDVDVKVADLYEKVDAVTNDLAGQALIQSMETSPRDFEGRIASLELQAGFAQNHGNSGQQYSDALLLSLL